MELMTIIYLQANSCAEKDILEEVKKAKEQVKKFKDVGICYQVKLTSSLIDERVLKRLYLDGFETCFDNDGHIYFK